MTDAEPTSPPEPAGHSVGRRRFLGYVLAGPTLVTAAGLAPAPAARADGIPSPEITELVDLNDVMTAAALPTSGLITVEVGEDGSVSFALPRTEVGQGITTSTAMLIAEELDLPVDRVRVTLADARPELLFNQLTGASNTTVSTFVPVRVAAAVARGRLLRAASAELGVPESELTLKDGTVTGPAGRRVGIGALAAKAAAVRTERVAVDLKPRERFTVIGRSHGRVDALAAVTGRKRFTMDLDVPDAKPTMVCRPPTINGRVGSVANLAEVRALPGVTDVAVIGSGVAVRAETFGQCIDAVRALRVSWRPGTAEGKSDEVVLKELEAAELPLGLPPLTPSVEARFTFAFRGNSALEPNCAIADVRADRAEVWSSLKAPIVAKEAIAAKLGLPLGAVTVHVTEGGGSFGRKLFFDAALEAVEASRAMGKPVKLMWHRADDARQGRAHPMATSRVRISYLGNTVLGYRQRHTSVATDLSHGLGEIFTALAARLPVGDIGFSETFFQLSQNMPYDFGAHSRLLSETDKGFNTGSMRNVYSPDVTCARELLVDRLAGKMGKDPYTFRRDFLRDDRAKAVLEKAAETGNWGRAMPDGMAQGIAFHSEYHSVSAVLVEIDCRPETVGRTVRDAVTGPRVTKAVVAVDVGLTVNPRGLEAQMAGCLMDGIALALTAGLHLRDGHFLEASWDNYFYTRQWNTPPELRVVVMPDSTGEPGGAGELGVAASMAAVACAYGRATGTMPTRFPVNHGTLSFEPKPTVPPVPASPTDGLDHVR
ncbi:molybdopterin cofactor-binding domain-containing protein [Streptomyces griseoviridis]|uniref:Isoquinoline 1-oxidoreductase beta subunit n=3 Tax=Streptomyces TaxID=1883 RepID=A0ABT9L7F7_STRGD|nr:MULTISPECIES: molybdopterin cofactor-binding domain-containing protein [Streptomyces]MDP9679636.1 isoquinoline 1-oxidoreductase beta subunit [Streptomyces griseoviridis]GGS39816.1 isoquinoline 1-oxidoreductase subunit beta [Streptomyces niveoruber]GGS99747.1 isoquinoline 1-oxidoreductase subunit beta [Streptomyces griseoviridis]GGU23863.1 isoquinoline 1-oxidoreductase subunit beta [Streptomyces daghestanicus]GHI29908.1 isoquinoline 1-oxidoreductase subunit beta [Streptomyces daghestanicus]